MLNILFLKNTPILDQLKLEEALFRADSRNWCLINIGSPPSIVLGISQKVDEVVDETKLQEIPLIRRFSGGGTVVVEPETVFVSLILSNEMVQGPIFPKTILTWTEELYRPAFGTLPFSLRENDYVIGNKKCGGNAQSFAKNRFVHHTSFLWDYSDKHMNFLKMPPKMPVYREGRNHQDFLQPLKPFFPCQQKFAEGILACVSEKFAVKLASWEEACEALELPHRKSTHLISWEKGQNLLEEIN